MSTAAGRSAGTALSQIREASNSPLPRRTASRFDLLPPQIRERLPDPLLARQFSVEVKAVGGGPGSEEAPVHRDVDEVVGVVPAVVGQTPWPPAPGVETEEDAEP